MATDLPKEFDVIVLGTGMPESIAAAAFSRIGQSVLHLDRNEFYSGDWASFNLQGIENWAKQHKDPEEGGTRLQRPSGDEISFLEPDEVLVQLPLYNSSFSDINLTFHVEQGEEEELPNKKGPETISVPTNENTEVVLEQETLMPESAHIDLTTEAVNAKVIARMDQNATNIDDESNSKAVENLSLNKDNAPREDNLKEDSKLPGSKPGTHSNEKGVLDKADCDKTLEAKTDQNGSENCDKTALSETVEDFENKKKEWTVKSLKAEWRKFNLDLSPKVLYSGGDMVDLLISSDIAKYCEFKTVTRLLTLLNGKLEKVPCSRADVFSSKKVSMIEKRMLMKFLQFCVESENKQEEIQDFLQKPFTEFLAHKKLTSNVKHYIQHSIAMATDSTTTEQGLLQMKKFLKSVGRYGNTAFLWSLYGSGELPQSFCRMCAVFGGIYCLRMTASSIVVNKENRCVGVITTEGQRISCKWLIMEKNYAPAQYVNKSSSRSLSRAIIMTDKPLLPTSQQELSLMCLPCPDDDDRPIFILELPPASLACPKDSYIFHLTRKGQPNTKPEENLIYAVEKLFQDGNEMDPSTDKPSILWSAYFSQCDTSCAKPTNVLPPNIVLMSGPGSEIDIDWPVREAKEVFHKILPDEDFLPKAPNPEDIIYVDDAEAQVVENNSQSEFIDTETSQSELKDTERNQLDCIITENNQTKEETINSSKLETKYLENDHSDIKDTEGSKSEIPQSEVTDSDSSQLEVAKTDTCQLEVAIIDNNQLEVANTDSSQL